MPEGGVEGFVWDTAKNQRNIARHGIAFEKATLAFEDPTAVIVNDPAHSGVEERFFCIGCVDDKIVTVRFTYRGDHIRIIGAGYWRKGRKLYEEQKEI